jgi:uncharacterized protein (UPF0332 family)
LQERDPDGSVNRSYYAMFDIARAALLTVGIDQQLSGTLGRTESLRLMADYMGTSLDAKTASDTVAWAEKFVRTVEKTFDLDEPSMANDLENNGSNEETKVSEPDPAVDLPGTDYRRVQPGSLEQIRRQARENWLKLRQQHIDAEKGLGPFSEKGVRGIEERGSHSMARSIGRSAYRRIRRGMLVRAAAVRSHTATSPSATSSISAVAASTSSHRLMRGTASVNTGQVVTKPSWRLAAASRHRMCQASSRSSSA